MAEPRWHIVSSLWFWPLELTHRELQDIELLLWCHYSLDRRVIGLSMLLPTGGSSFHPILDTTRRTDPFKSMHAHAREGRHTLDQG